MSADLAGELLRLERALAERDPSGVEGGLASLIADGFVEHGASGRIWDRESVVAHLLSGPPRPVSIAGFAVHPVASDVAVAAYEVTMEPGTADERRSVRTSVWSRRDGRWRMVFHRGTLVPSGKPSHNLEAPWP